jgi:hypothetical protein
MGKRESERLSANCQTNAQLYGVLVPGFPTPDLMEYDMPGKVSFRGSWALQGTLVRAGRETAAANGRRAMAELGWKLVNGPFHVGQGAETAQEVEM